jgi:hypothetical protein
VDCVAAGLGGGVELGEGFFGKRHGSTVARFGAVVPSGMGEGLVRAA